MPIVDPEIINSGEKELFASIIASLCVFSIFNRRLLELRRLLFNQRRLIRTNACYHFRPNPVLGINLFIVTKKMKRVWHNYKIWILIGMAYFGFYSFKGFETVVSLLSRLRKNRISQSIYTKSNS